MTRSAQFGGLWIVAGILLVTGCGGGGGVVPPNATVVVSPKLAAVVATSQTQQFTATVTGNVSNLTVTWSVDAVAGGSATVGTISASGLYTPPATGGTHTVTAASVALPTSSASASVAVTDLAGVFTYHNDLSRDGANTQEYALTSSTVGTATFGKLFSCAVDGAVYTQPLWVPGLSIGGGTHNVVFVATQHDSLYAFDADASPCVTYWQAKLLDPALHGGTANETPVTWNDVGVCFGDVYPEVGVTGTPVIDPATNTIYVVSASESNPTSSGDCSGSVATFYHRLHALDLVTGNEKHNGPITIAASVAGVGDGSVGGVLTFNSQLHHQRSGLALSSDGIVYVAFAAHEDATPYHGWLFGYNAANLQQKPHVFNTTPNGVSGPNGGADGGIWGAGGAPAVDSANNVYVATGNGIFDQGTGMAMRNDYGDSVLSLSPLAGTTSMQVNGWFSPDDEANLEAGDVDLGSGAPVLLPDQTSGPKHLLIQLGKDGVVYLINRDIMGFYNSGSNQVVQYFQATNDPGFWGTPAFWENNLYFAGAGDVLKQFSFAGGQFNTTAASQSSQGFGFPDVTPSVSSQGTSNGIVWGIDAGLYGYASPNSGNPNSGYCFAMPVPSACTGPAILHAYDATNLATEYWNSAQAASNRDQAGNAVKFVPPTIANGKVYVSTRTEVDIYGLLPN
jgi:hypothetical protein